MSFRIIYKNAFYLLFSNVLVRLITAIATILVARYLGANEFGILSVALSFAAVAGYFTDMGLSHTLLREASKKEADLPILMSGFFKVRLMFAFGTAIISLFIIYFAYSDSHIQVIFYWIVMPTIFGGALQGVGAVYFQAIQKMQYTALIRGISGITTASILFIGIIWGWPLYLIAVTYGFSNILAGLLSLFLVLRKISFKDGWNKKILNGLFSFTLGGFIVMILPQMGPLVLERVTDFREVGFFAAAYRIPSLLYQIPGVVAAAFYPLLFKHGADDQKENHLRLNILELKTMNIFGIVMALPFLFYSEWWIVLLFGLDWKEASNVLVILSMVVIFHSINYPLADALTTKGLQHRRTIVLIVGLIVGVCLFSSLGYRWGAFGGAIAAIITESILTIGFIISNPLGWKTVYKGAIYNILAFFLTAAFISLVIGDVTPWIGIPISLIVFIILVSLFDKEIHEFYLSKKRRGLFNQH